MNPEGPVVDRGEAEAESLAVIDGTEAVLELVLPPGTVRSAGVATLTGPEVEGGLSIQQGLIHLRPADGLHSPDVPEGDTEEAEERLFEHG